MHSVYAQSLHCSLEGRNDAACLHTLLLTLLNLFDKSSSLGIPVWTGLKEHTQRWRRLIQVSDVRTTVFFGLLM